MNLRLNVAVNLINRMAYSLFEKLCSKNFLQFPARTYDIIIAMDNIRIEEMNSLNQVEIDPKRAPGKHCLYYKEEICSPSKMRFAACKTCFRCNPSLAIKSLFVKIKKLAAELLNLPAPEPDQFPLEK